MKEKKYIIDLGHADYDDEDLAVGGRRVFAGLSDKGGMHLFATDITRVSLLELALFKLVFAPQHLRLTSKL